MDITARNFLQDYNNHRIKAIWLRMQMEQVAEGYGYHKQAREHMIDIANWTGYPSQSIPAINETYPCEPPPIIGHHIKHHQVAYRGVVLGPHPNMCWEGIVKWYTCDSDSDSDSDA